MTEHEWIERSGLGVAGPPGALFDQEGVEPLSVAGIAAVGLVAETG